MPEILKPDICVIGGGSGGLTVAAAAAAFGVPVVLVEGGRMGGDCLNYGCVPSKALIAAGKTAETMRHADLFGIASVQPEVNFARVHDHIRSVIASIAPNDSVERFTVLGVHVIRDYGRFVDRRTLIAGDYEIEARRFVIATGSSPAVPPIPGLADVPYFTNETIFDQTRKPGHLVIIGGGPIGMELAQAHRRLGSAVTVLEGGRALGKDDPEMTAVVLESLRAEGIDIREGARVTGVTEKSRTTFSVRYETADGAGEVAATHILVAAGRTANIEALQLNQAGVRTRDGAIRVNRALRTSNRRIYAIGDVTGGLQFTHVAGYHAGLVVQSILFRIPGREKRHLVPWATYTDPELAHVGLNEEAARKKNRRITVLRWPYAENDRAQTEHRTTGHVKIVADAKGRILGASIVGAGAGEMINMFALAVAKKMRIGDLRAYISPYPTMSEMAKRAATAYYAPATRNPTVRWLIGFLRRFG